MSDTTQVDWRASQLAALPEVVIAPVDYAGSVELIYVCGSRRDDQRACPHRYGVDRFRIENGFAVEEHVIFDSATVQGPA